MSDKKIKIVAIAGSVRPDNNTNKALNLVVDELKKNSGLDVTVIDPNDLDLPLPGTDSNADVEKIKELVTQATGIILATPEYQGSYSSVIKLVIEHLGYPSVLSGKPVALLGVAAGQIGAIKALEHLRSVCSHVGAIVLPSPVSLAEVHNLFDESGQCKDPKMDKRIRRLATNLLQYIKDHICPKISLEQMVRESE